MLNKFILWTLIVEKRYFFDQLYGFLPFLAFYPFLGKRQAHEGLNRPLTVL